MSARTASRPVISGIGLVAPGARSVPGFWALLNDERPTLPGQFDAGVPLPNTLAYLAGDVAGGADSRAERLALHALHAAIADAQLPADAIARAGIVAGSGMGAIDLLGDGARQLYALPEVLARAVGAHGPNQAWSTACASSLYGAGLAAGIIERGEADVVFVAGVEICFPIGHAVFNRLNCLDSQLCRPFDVAREGTVFGEGAAVLVLESGAHWRARQGRTAYATVAGFGWSCDAHHVTAPDPEGRQIETAMWRALAQAGIGPESLGCVVPHGTGTALNDAVEAAALRRLLGQAAGAVPLLPVKSRIGHTGGAAGAFGCVAAALVAHHRSIPPTPNVVAADFGLCVPARAQAFAPGAHLLVNAYAFGGNNASLVLGGANAA